MLRSRSSVLNFVVVVTQITQGAGQGQPTKKGGHSSSQTTKGENHEQDRERCGPRTGPARVVGRRVGRRERRLEFEELPAVTDMLAACRPGSPLVARGMGR